MDSRSAELCEDVEQMRRIGYSDVLRDGAHAVADDNDERYVYDAAVKSSLAAFYTLLACSWMRQADEELTPEFADAIKHGFASAIALLDHTGMIPNRRKLMMQLHSTAYEWYEEGGER